jgi:hypothetical protein
MRDDIVVSAGWRAQLPGSPAPRGITLFRLCGRAAACRVRSGCCVRCGAGRRGTTSDLHAWVAAQARCAGWIGRMFRGDPPASGSQAAGSGAEVRASQAVQGCGCIHRSLVRDAPTHSAHGRVMGVCGCASAPPGVLRPDSMPSGVRDAREHPNPLAGCAVCNRSCVHAVPTHSPQRHYRPQVGPAAVRPTAARAQRDSHSTAACCAKHTSMALTWPARARHAHTHARAQGWRESKKGRGVSLRRPRTHAYQKDTREGQDLIKQCSLAAKQGIHGASGGHRRSR